jgi:hypothetical protein
VSDRVFPPAGIRFAIIVIVPYYFEFMMPSNLICTPLLVVDFQEKQKKIDCNERGVNML